MSKKQSTETKFLSGLISSHAHTFATKKLKGIVTRKRNRKEAYFSSLKDSCRACSASRKNRRVSCFCPRRYTILAHLFLLIETDPLTAARRKQMIVQFLSNNIPWLYHATFTIIVQFMYLLSSSTFPMCASLSNSSSSAILKHGHSKMTVKKVYLIRYFKQSLGTNAKTCFREEMSMWMKVTNQHICIKRKGKGVINHDWKDVTWGRLYNWRNLLHVKKIDKQLQSSGISTSLPYSSPYFSFRWLSLAFRTNKLK